MLFLLPSRILAILALFVLAVSCAPTVVPPASAKPKFEEYYPKGTFPITESEAEQRGARVMSKTAGSNLKNGLKGTVELPAAGFKGARVSMSNVKTHFKNGNYGKMTGSAAGVIAKPVASTVMGMVSPIAGAAGAVGAAGASLFNRGKSSISQSKLKATGNFAANGGGAKRLEDMKDTNSRLTYRNDHLTKFFTGKKAS